MTQQQSPPVRRIHAAQQIEPPRCRHIPLLLIPQNGDLYAVALNPCTTAVATHYVEARNSVVWCDETVTCEYCVGRGWKKHVTRYLPILSLGDKRQYLLVIPSQAYLYSESLTKAEGKLRGQQLEARRMGSSKRSPAKVVMSGKEFDPRTLPCGWDVLTQLAARWNIAPPGDAFEGGVK